jgi:hypothetical protein
VAVAGNSSVAVCQLDDLKGQMALLVQIRRRATHAQNCPIMHSRRPAATIHQRGRAKLLSRR